MRTEFRLPIGLRVACLSAFLILIVAPVARGGPQATTGPAGSHVITFSILLPDNSTRDISVREGTLARITNAKGYSVGFAARVNETKGDVTVKVYEIFHLRAGEGLDEKATLTPSRDRYTTFESSLIPLGFKVEEVDSIDAFEKMMMAMKIPMSPQCQGSPPECCHCCGEWCACACWVRDQCGQCCCSSC